ncbi:MAG: DUF4097 family beta strand repeat-containing protein [Candidatus Solibacter sp.]
MRRNLAFTAWLGAALFTGCASLSAQMHDNTQKQLSCADRAHDGDHARHCEVREQTLPAIGRLNVDGGANGGVSIKGWLRNEVLVRARIEASGETEGAAANLASRVMVDGNGGQVKASGPQGGQNLGWSVSYEIFVPQATDLTMTTNNGGIAIADVRGQIRFETRNGGVDLKRVEGDISGETSNGGISVDLAGANWSGRQMDLKTRNGGVQLTAPSRLSANIVAESGLGSIQSDFPMPQTNGLNNRERSRKVEFAVGAGGPPIHIATGNGGIRLKRSDGQQ